MELIEEITNAIKKLDEEEEYTDKLCDALSNADQKTSDLLHYIENNNINAAQSCHLIKEIKKVRIERRKIKNDMELARAFKDNVGKLINTENRKMILSKLHKTSKQLETEYHNRIYSKEELTEILDGEETDIRSV